MTPMIEQVSAENTALEFIREWHDGMDRVVWPPDLLRLQVKLSELLTNERAASGAVIGAFREMLQAERERAEIAERERDAYAAALQRIADEAPGMHVDHEGLLGACETCCDMSNDAAMTLGIAPVEGEQDPGDFQPF